MSFLKRVLGKPTPQSEVAAMVPAARAVSDAPLVGDETCVERDCGSQTAVPCAYRDRRGRNWAHAHDRCRIVGAVDRIYIRGIATRLAGDVPPEAPVSPAAPVGSQDQQAAFARGATLQRDGDYDGAVGVFGTLASASAPDVAFEARVRLGQSLIAAKRPADALDPLQAAETAQPGSAASYLLGRAMADLGRCQDALPHFEQFASGNPAPLAAQAGVARANWLADLGRAADAVSLLAQAAGSPDLARLQTLDYRERLARMRVRAGDADDARAEYQSLLSIARSSSYQSELDYYLGVLAPDPPSAAAFFRAAVQLDTKGRAAQAALDELVALHDPFAQSFEAGDTRFAQNRYREALAAYTSFLQQNSADPRAARAVYGRGASLVRLGQDRSGVAVLESIADRFPSASEAADGLFRGGRIRESLADLDGAAAAYRREPGAAADPVALRRAIAARLNADGISTAHGTSFAGGNVHVCRKRWGIPTVKINGVDPNPLRWSDGSYSVQGAAAALGITAQTVFKWLRKGRLQGKQLVKGQPWQIQIADKQIAQTRKQIRQTTQSRMEAS